MKNIFLIEDHDEALKLWKESRIRNLDLVHIDAHIDFGFYMARPINDVIRQAKSLKELKNDLERSIAFKRYENDFDKQVNIGNYIYPAMEEGIVKDFYWVMPGGIFEFESSVKIIKRILNGLNKYDLNARAKTQEIKPGIVSIQLFGRKFVICILDKLPKLKHKILLDIDTDFLVIDSLRNASNAVGIGNRKPWILPDELVVKIKNKLTSPKFITIAYSVNGGYTPMRYKYLADEVAYCFSPIKFREHFKRSREAAFYFDNFCETNKKIFYQKAVKHNPLYRAPDNNYGPLYLGIGEISKAKKEFLKILAADPRNPSCFYGLGEIALKEKDFLNARKCFSAALKKSNNNIFDKIKISALLGLAKAEFMRRNFKMSKTLLYAYLSKRPLDAQAYYFLGQISEKERNFSSAVKFYQDAIRLGFDNALLLKRILKIICYLPEKNSIIDYISEKYKKFQGSKKDIANIGKEIKKWRKI